MANAWFRMYSEFANDPKVQTMSEAMQRRLSMLFCLQCSECLVSLTEDELAFALRISTDDLQETKKLFIRKGFIDSGWALLNWEKRQFCSDSSTERTRRHRERKREQSETSQERSRSAPEQNRTEQNKAEQNRTEQSGFAASRADAPKPYFATPQKLQTDDSWEIFEEAAAKADMGMSDEERISLCSITWPRLSFEQRLCAVDAINRRHASGEYADGYTPGARRYLEKKLWTAPDRKRPQPRKSVSSEAADRVTAMIEREECEAEQKRRKSAN